MILRKKIDGLVWALWVVMFALSGCANQTGTDTGNPTSVGIKFIGLENPAGKNVSVVSSHGADISEARVVLKELDLDPLSTCLTVEEETPGPDEFDFELGGPFVVNLLDNTSIPDPNNFSVPSGPYCEIDLTFDQLHPQALPGGISSDDPIVGNALIIRGHRLDGVPFVVLLQRDDRFRIEASSATGFDIFDQSGFSRFFISFDLSLWFAGINLEALPVSSDGILHVDDANNSVVLSAIVDNVIHSVQLFRDLNGNGILEPDEELESLVLGEGVDEPN